MKSEQAFDFKGGAGLKNQRRIVFVPARAGHDAPPPPAIDFISLNSEVTVGGVLFVGS